MTITRERLAHVWDVLHFVVQVGEIREVTFIWYRMKFKPDRSEKTAAREWERFKHLLGRLKIPFEKQKMEDDAGFNTIAVKFKLPEAWDRISHLLGDDQDDEEGKHSQGGGPDRAHHPVLAEGKQRHVHVSLREVDTQQRARRASVMRHSCRR